MILLPVELLDFDVDPFCLGLRCGLLVRLFVAQDGTARRLGTSSSGVPCWGRTPGGGIGTVSSSGVSSSPSGSSSGSSCSASESGA